MGPILFAAVLAAIFTGYPVAFAIGGVSLIFGAIGVQVEQFSPAYLEAMVLRVQGIMSNQVLLAVPFFILMGTVLERSRLAEDLLQTIGQLFGSLRGGLALAVVVVGTLLAAATGVVGASVVAMGTISLPIMLRYGYGRELSTGVIAASGTLGQIIPPSVVLVVLADQIGASVGDLFRGALVPGLLIAGLYAAWVAWTAWRKPELAPALPPEQRALAPRALARRVLLVMLPPLALIVIVLGSIFWGVATPTEAGALGAVGALVLAALAGRLTRAMVREAAEITSRLTCMVLLLLVGSTLFSLVFRGFDGDLWVEGLLTDLPGGRVGALVVANLAIFVLGFFIDFFEIAFIVVPLLAPVFVGRFGMSPVWFGIMVAVNLQTSFLTPPFGFALFYLKGVCPPSVRTVEIYRGVAPFIAIQLAVLAALLIWPELVTALL
ncbi:MAG: TRAP transporter large permease subunit [Planctomycetota bacterium]|nr:MAG: TRAP transporter large permease subunit [Planctomycetota bacterium]